MASSRASKSLSPRSCAFCKEAISLSISFWASACWQAFFFRFGIFGGAVAQSFAQGEKLGSALLELDTTLSRKKRGEFAKPSFLSCTHIASGSER
jgi:hypothetical protein